MKHPNLNLEANAKAFSEPCQTFKRKVFAKIVTTIIVFSYFRKKLHVRCLAGL